MPSTTAKEFWIVESGPLNPRVHIQNNVQPEIKRGNHVSTLDFDTKLMEVEKSHHVFTAEKMGKSFRASSTDAAVE